MIDIDIYIEKGLIEKVNIISKLSGNMQWNIFSTLDYESSCTLHRAENWLESYKRKKPPACSLPFNWEKVQVSPFTKKVLDFLLTLPFGKTVTYGELAKLLGCPNAARAVGGACGRNPFPILIPCHRVVAVNSIGGFSADLQIKKYLLQLESH